LYITVVSGVTYRLDSLFVCLLLLILLAAGMASICQPASHGVAKEVSNFTVQWQIQNFGLGGSRVGDRTLPRKFL